MANQNTKTIEEINALLVRGLDLGANKEILDEAYDKDAAVKCVNGTFVGVKESGILAWKGIPFAQPPIGDLRFKAPVAPDPSEAVFEAYNYGKKPLSTDMPNETEHGEDCLYLNIFTGDNNLADKPVMVWVHGGAFVEESASDEFYRGDAFAIAHPDCILVTIEYRLGPIGFALFDDVPGGEAYAGSENNGLKDQVMALRWIKENIAGFGGDPENITIFGESAGGVSVASLPLVEDAKGLFQKVIIQSGFAGFSLASTKVNNLAGRALCEANGVGSMEELLSVPEEDLRNNMYAYVIAADKAGAMGLGTVADGSYIPTDPYAAYARGEAGSLQFMLGSNREECRYFIDTLKADPTIDDIDARFLEFMRVRYDKVKRNMSEEDIALAEQFMASTGKTEANAIESLMTELCFGIPARHFANILSKENDAYLYSFEFPTYPYPEGSKHAAEVPFVFANDALVINKELDYSDLMSTVGEVWTSFAKTGVPTIYGKDAQLYNESAKPVIVFDDTGKSAEIERYFDDREETLAPLLKYENTADVANFFDILDAKEPVE